MCGMEDRVKNHADAMIFHTAICAAGVTNKNDCRAESDIRLAIPSTQSVCGMEDRMGRFIIGARLHDYGCGTPDEMFAKVAADGFESVQLAYRKAISGIGSYADVTPEVVAQTVEAEKKHHIQVGVLGTYVQMGINDENVRRQNVRDYISQLSVCKAIGASCIGNETTEMYNQPAGTTRERGQYLFCKSMDEVLPEAERLGVQVAMEPVYYHSVNSPRAAWKVLQAMQSPNFKIIFDPANLVALDNVDRQQEIWDEVGELLGDKIVAVHFKGMNFRPDGSGDFFSTSLAESCVDYAGAFRMLKQLPQDIHVLREEAVPAIAAEDIAFMKQFF